MKGYVLSGGGMKGSFQAGYSQARAEQGYEPDIIVGTSTGSLGTFMLGADVSAPYSFQGRAEAIIDQYLSFRSYKDIYRKNHFWNIPRKGLKHLKPLRKILEQELAGFKGFIKESLICVVDLESGRPMIVSLNKLYEEGKHDLLIDMIISSCSFPPEFAPVYSTKGRVARHYADGGIRDIAPLGAAIDRGATEITVVLCEPTNPGWWPWNPRMDKWILRSLQLAVNEIMINDIRICKKTNEYVDVVGEAAAGGKKFIQLHIVEPDMKLWSKISGGLPYLGTLEVDLEKIKYMIEFGKQTASSAQA